MAGAYFTSLRPATATRTVQPVTHCRLHGQRSFEACRASNLTQHGAIVCVWGGAPGTHARPGQVDGHSRARRRELQPRGPLLSHRLRDAPLHGTFPGTAPPGPGRRFGDSLHRRDFPCARQRPGHRGGGGQLRLLHVQPVPGVGTGVVERSHRRNACSRGTSRARGERAACLFVPGCAGLGWALRPLSPAPNRHVCSTLVTWAANTWCCQTMR